jgi:ppGpp synthetase/RelA/SpoT-type nucleotidyltranferase
VKEFGYVGEHFILRIPSDVSIDCENENPLEFFELQIKTLFQHAWSEAEHDIGYKSPTELNALQLRKIAFTAAQAWGADLHFDELVKEIVTAEN